MEPLRSRILATALAGLTVVVSGCGGDDTSSTASSATTATEQSERSTAGPTIAETLPHPDESWTGELIAANDAFLDGDLERNLDFLDAAAAEPEREVELFVEYVRTLSAAVSALLGEYPAVPTDDGIGDAATDFQEALERRRDELDAIADDLSTARADLQAALDAGDDAEYASWRSMLADDPSIDACFALQSELDAAGLGLLRCIPGPEGEVAGDGSAPAPVIDLGPDAGPLTVELSFGPDASEPIGTFEVVEGASSLGCAAGSWLDTELSDDGVQLTKVLTCEDGERSGSITVTSWYDGSEVWIVSDADDGFTGLAGTGTSSFDPATGTELFTGQFTLP